MKSVVYLTRAKQKSLEDQLHYMENDGVRKLSQLLAASPGSGMGRPLDLPIHDVARVFYTEMDEIKKKLRAATIIDDIVQDTDTIAIGATVDLLDEETKSDITYTILGSDEAEPSKERISNLSPLGSAMLGKRIGETIYLKSIDKKFLVKKIEYNSLAFEYQPKDWNAILDSTL